MEDLKNKADIILTDFAWGEGIYGKRTNPNTKFGGGAMGHYKTMTMQEVLDFKSEIDKVASDDCMLLQWVTCPSLKFGIEVMEHFGFKYKTVAMTWIKIAKNGKPRILPSYYFGSNTELLLLGIKGKNNNKFRPAQKLLGQVIMSELRQHSRKPEESYEKINLAYPTLNKVEFFSRFYRDGWTCYGDEVGKFNIKYGE